VAARTDGASEPVVTVMGGAAEVVFDVDPWCVVDVAVEGCDVLQAPSTSAHTTKTPDAAPLTFVVIMPPVFASVRLEGTVSTEA
jgi:hypothetical protein